MAGHDDIHAGETAHGTHIHHIVLGLAVAEPGGHEVLQAVHGSGGYGGLLVGLGDAKVEGGETLILARDIDARLEVGVIDGETWYYFHVNVECF